MNPKFSIAIPVYNRPDYLRQAIRSALGQTACDFEIVVSDDCSTDNLCSVVSSFCDPRISYHRSTKNLGAAKNHQLSVSLSRGEYVVNLHSDDLLLPSYLEVAGRALDECREAAAVYSAMTYLVGSKIDGYYKMPRLHFANRQTYIQNPWLEKFHRIAPTCCLFRRLSFDKLGGYRTFLRFVYDWDLYFRFMTAGEGVLFLPEILSIYRKHEQQASEVATLDAVYDLLDLWRLEEYSHFKSSEIADLVIRQVRRAIIAKSGWLDIVQQVRARGLLTPVLWGAIAGLPRNVWRTVKRSGPAEEDGCLFELPLNLEGALQTAKAVVGN
jgi:glycosyltransferase involved in cell wall biosynthesis